MRPFPWTRLPQVLRCWEKGGWNCRATILRPLPPADPSHAGAVLSSLDGEGRWIGPLNWVLVPYIGPGSADDPVPDTYEQTLGNPHNTASLVTEPVEGVCLRTYINNMATLIASLANRENR